jgi:heme exporter protein C
MSVEWWSTLHQPASLTISNKPAIDLVMLYPLLGSIIGFTGIVTCLVILSSKLQILKRERNKSWIKDYV